MEKINYGLEKMHGIQLGMYKKLTEVCRSHGLTQFLGFGSLLGAVRDHRIIPWDDAIDVVMPYPDFEKLLTLPREVWGGDLFLQTYGTDPEYPKYYAKLRHSGTTLITAEFVDCDINQGIYINIMPLVRLSNSPKERRQQVRNAKLYKAVAENRPLPSGDGTLSLYSALLLRLTSKRSKARKRETLKKKVINHEGEETKDCFVLAGEVSLTLALPAKWFASGVEWEFEGMDAKIPAGWHEWLTLRYGDYMVAPISELQGDRISKFVYLDTEKPYTEYKGKTYCEKINRAGKR